MKWDDINEEDIKIYEGFVYLIVNKLNNKKYIGQKKFYSTTKKPPLKGRINKRICKKLVDWKNYWGSNKELKNDIKKHGVNNFEKFILHLCKRKSQMNYLEMQEQILNNVLLKPDEYYNSIIQVRISRNQLNFNDFIYK